MDDSSDSFELDAPDLSLDLPPTDAPAEIDAVEEVPDLLDTSSDTPLGTNDALQPLDGTDREAQIWNNELQNVVDWRDSPGGEGRYAQYVVDQMYAPSGDPADGNGDQWAPPLAPAQDTPSE